MLSIDDSYRQERRPLTSDERKTLRAGFVFIGIFTAFCVGIFSFAFYMLELGKGGEGWVVFIFALFAAIFAAVIVVQIYKVMLDLAEGEKLVLTGEVTQKEQYVPTKSGRRGSRGHTKYYLHFGSKKLEVQSVHYSGVNAGDIVEVHYAPHSKRAFAAVVTNAAATPHANQPRASIPLAAAVHGEAPLEADDLSALRKTRNRALFRRLLGAAVALYFFLGFALEGLWFLVLLFSPMIAVFCYQLYALVRTINSYNKDRAAGAKAVRILQVTDKQIVRRRGTHYLLFAGMEQLSVEESLYENVDAGDKIAVHTGMFSGQLLGVRRGDEQ